MERDFRVIPISVSGGRRSDLPAGHPEFPGQDSPDMANVLMYEGRLRKWPGRLALTEAAIDGPVRFLGRFDLSGGTQHLVASDGRDIWRYDAAGDEWVLITPVYVEGTATFVTDSDQVVGSSTDWTADNCRPGMFIRHDSDGIWYEVEGLHEGTQTITLTEDYQEAGGAGAAYTLRQRRSAAGERWMRAVVASDLLIVVNGVDPPLAWDGATASMELLGGGPPVARYVSTFHHRNLLVMARDQNSPLRVQHSDAGDYEEWAADLAASYDFEDSTAPIVGVDGAHEYLYMFRRDGNWRGFWEGTGVGMSWVRTPGIDGPVYPHSLVRLGGGSGQASMEAQVARWAYFGLANIHTFDGDRIDTIGDPVRSLVFESLDPTYVDSVVGAVIPEWGLAVWSYPTIGSEGVPTHSIAYDYRRGLWFPREVGFSAFGGYDLTATDEIWDDLEGEIDQQRRIFDAINVAPQPVCLVGDENGRVCYLAWGVNDDGQVIRARRSTPVFAVGDGHGYYQVGAIEFRTSAQAGTACTVSVFGGERPEALELLQQATVRTGQGQCVAYLRCAARFLQVRLDNEELDGEFGLYDLRVWVRPAGGGR